MNKLPDNKEIVFFKGMLFVAGHVNHPDGWIYVILFPLNLFADFFLMGHLDSISYEEFKDIQKGESQYFYQLNHEETPLPCCEFVSKERLIRADAKIVTW